jgi:hypothetical protein
MRTKKILKRAIPGLHGSPGKDVVINQSVMPLTI